MEVCHGMYGAKVKRERREGRFVKDIIMAAADSIPTTPVVGNHNPLGLGNNKPIGLSASLGLDAAAAEASFFPKPVEIAKIEDSSHVIITFKKLDFDSQPNMEPLGVDDQEGEEEGDDDDSRVTSQEYCLLPLPSRQRIQTAAATHKYAKCSSDNEELPRSMRRKVHVTYHESDSSGNGEEYDDDPGFVHQLPPPATNASKPKLPIGVVRGCPSCHGCQKVVAAWRPDAGCKPYLDEAPVFYPEEEEFKDPLAYIASIRTRAEQFGICRVVPPQSWRPPCPLRENSAKFDKMWFPTRVQQVHKLQVREPISKESSPAKQGRKRRRGRLSIGRMGGGVSSATGAGASEIRMFSTKPLTPPDEQQEFFGFEPGIPFQLGSFEKYAKDFKDQYFRNTADGTSSEQHHANINGEEQKWEPSIDMIEGEYWRIVEQATEQIEVLYGADVETGQFGSGFPKEKPGTILDPSSYEKSGWNLNNIARQPGSMLSFEEGDISGVLVPWLYIGMCFSSFCWHVEDHHFYSLNYLHWGAPKIWYGVPSIAASQLEAAMKKHLPDLFDEQPDLLHKLVTQLSPSILKQEGIPVYRLVQQAGDYVITFPHAYHAGFNSGFNVAEAVNVAPVDWLLHGQAAVELYREQCRKTSVSHDKLLLRAARLAVKMSWWSAQQSLQGRERRGGTLLNSLPSQLSIGSVWETLHGQTKGLESEIVRASLVLHGQGSVLARALEERLKMEYARSQSLKDIAGGLPSFLKKKKMDSNYDVTDERECELCKYDLHLSAVGCECCPEKFSCLLHGHLLCSCPWNKKTLLYRYSLEELASLLAAVQGQRGAVSKWTNFELQLPIPSDPPSLYKDEKKLQIHLPLPACVTPQQKPEIQQVLSNGATGLKKSCADIGICIPNSSAAPAGTVGFPQQVKMEAEVIVGAEVKLDVRDWVGRLLRTEAETEVEQPLSSLPLADISGNIMGAFNHNVTESESGVRPSQGGSLLVVNGTDKRIAQFSEDVRCRLDAAVSPPLVSSLPIAKSTAKRMAAINSSPLKTLRTTGNASSCSSCSFVPGVVKKEPENQQETGSFLKLWSGATDAVKESVSKPVETNVSSPWLQHDRASVEYLPPHVTPSPDVGFGGQHKGMSEHGHHHCHHPAFVTPKLQGSQKENCVAEVIVLSDDEDEKKEQVNIINELPKAKDIALGNSAQQQMICVTARMVDCPFDEDAEGTSAAATDKAFEVDIQRDSTAKVGWDKRDGVPPHNRELVVPFTDGAFFGGDRSNAGQQLDLDLPMTKLSQPVAAAAESVKPTTQVHAVKYDGTTTLSPPVGRPMSVENNIGATTSCSIVHHLTETAKADTVVKLVHANGRQQNGCQLQQQQQARGSTTITNGPRVARVVRSKRSSVELLDTGRLVLRSGWHNKHFIFPAGFKSQIRFYDIIDISHSCIYVSEIVDQGAHTRPLFKVSQPSSLEVFLHESADECWHEIHTRVNDVIIHRRSGHNKLQQQQQLPPLLPPLNGLEMFGLTSPSIVQAVEALDPQHQCMEYWTAKQEFGRSLKSQDQVQRLTSVEVQKQGRNMGCYAVQAHKPHSRSLLHEQGSLASQQVGMKMSDVVVTGISPVNRSTNDSTNQLPQEPLGTAAAAVAEADTNLINRSLKLRRSDLYPVLRGFFHKADTEELQVLHRLFQCEMQGDEWRSGVHALTDELQTRISQRMATEAG